jgi:hypothetical protein
MAPRPPPADPGALIESPTPSSRHSGSGFGVSQGNSHMPPVEEVLEFERRKKEAMRFQRQQLNSLTSAHAFDARSGRSLGFPAASKPRFQRQASHASPAPDMNNPSAFPAVQGRFRPSQPPNKLWTPARPRFPEMLPTDQMSRNSTLVISSQVPLEHIPESSATHHLSTKVDCDLAHILCSALNLATFDTYIANGKISCEDIQLSTANVAPRPAATAVSDCGRLRFDVTS